MAKYKRFVPFGVLLAVQAYAWAALLMLAWWQLFFDGQPPHNVGQFKDIHSALVALSAVALIPATITAFSDF